MRYKKSPSVPAWVWVIVGVANFMLLTCCGSGGYIYFSVLPAVRKAAVAAKERNERENAAAQLPPINAEDLWKAYDDNPSQAAAKYGSGRILVRIRIDEASQNGRDFNIIQRIGQNQFPHVDIRIPIESAQKATVKTTILVRAKIWHADRDYIGLDDGAIETH